MQLSPETLRELRRLIRQWTGLALSPDKDYLIRHRLAPVVRNCGFSGYEELLLRLQAKECSHIREAVIEAITTKETSFFRDEWLFECLFKSVLPEIVRQPKQAGALNPRIRICSAGTSTGQEAYSIAMIVREFLDGGFSDLAEKDVSVLGLDISAEAIEVAKAGLYSEGEVKRGISPARVRRHFQKQGEGWRVGDPLRRLVHFQTANLIAPMNVGTFDLILCRNVMIYFDEATRAIVLRNLRASLREHGWLALGSAESLQGNENGFESVKFGRAFLYRTSNKS